MENVQITNLEDLAKNAIEIRHDAFKARTIKFDPMSVNVDDNTVTIGDKIIICVNGFHLEKYLNLEIEKANMINDSVKTKRFDARAYKKLKDEQATCIKPFIKDETEVELAFETEDSTEVLDRYSVGNDAQEEVNFQYWTEKELTNYLSGVPEDGRRNAIKVLRDSGAPEDILQKAIRNSRK